MKNTLYEYFDQGTVIETINQIPSAITWLNLDHSIFASNETCLKLSGFTTQAKAEGNSYINMPCQASECYQEFIAEDERAKKIISPVEFLGLYCFHKDEWKVTYGTKSLIKNSEKQPAGICAHAIEIKDLYITNFVGRLMQLENHFKFSNKKLQLSYRLTDAISTDTFSLTKSQSECLFYLLRGFNVPMIAQKLFISRRTVESHIENIKLKAGCFTKPQLIEKALHEGWLNTIPKSILKRSL
jgi:DNA-binding CsgD family transcriptional regulator